MQAFIYIRDNAEMPIYEQFNKCFAFAKRHGYFISGKVLDFDGKHFHEAVNKVIANNEISALLIYSKETAFNDYEETIFYRVYLEKLGKKLIACE